MTKFYCDICGKEVEHETDDARAIQITIRENKFSQGYFYNKTRPFVMRDECYDKLSNCILDRFTKYVLQGGNEK